MAVYHRYEPGTPEYDAADDWMRTCINYHDENEHSRAIRLCRRGLLSSPGIWFADLQLPRREAHEHMIRHLGVFRGKPADVYRVYLDPPVAVSSLVQPSAYLRTARTDVELTFERNAVILHPKCLELCLVTRGKYTLLEYDVYEQPRPVLETYIGKAHIRKNKHDVADNSVYST